jgi:hypothetical protein
VLTVPEFNAAHDRHLRRVQWLFLVFLACLLNAWMWDFDSVVWVHTHIDESIPSWAVRVGVYTTPITLLFPVGLLLVRWAHRDPRLCCPLCDKGLVRHRFKVVVTRHCPRCNREILTDPDRQLAPTITRIEVESLARRNLRRNLTSILGLALGCAVGAGLGLGAERLKDMGWLSETVAICITAGGVLAFFALMTYSVICVIRQLRERITCPRCHARLYPEMAAKWGGCGWCGQRMIADPPAGMLDGNGG